MIFKPVFLSLCLGAMTLPTLCPALQNAEGDRLLLTVVNHSDHTLSYTGVKHTKPGNIFTLTSNDILPGASITISVSSTRWSGIAGDLSFKDTSGHQSILHIRDPLQISIMQHPETFTMKSPGLVSFVPARTLNIDDHPYSLAWTKATVEIQNRIKAV